jgi:hypothetical protein
MDAIGRARASTVSEPWLASGALERLLNVSIVSIPTSDSAPTRVNGTANNVPIHLNCAWIWQQPS